MESDLMTTVLVISAVVGILVVAKVWWLVRWMKKKADEEDKRQK